MTRATVAMCQPKRKKVIYSYTTYQDEEGSDLETGWGVHGGVDGK